MMKCGTWHEWRSYTEPLLTSLLGVKAVSWAATVCKTVQRNSTTSGDGLHEKGLSPSLLMHQPCTLTVQVFLFVATKSNLYPHGKQKKKQKNSIFLHHVAGTIISKQLLWKLTTDCFLTTTLVLLLLTNTNLRKLFWKHLFPITF